MAICYPYTYKHPLTALFRCINMFKIMAGIRFKVRFRVRDRLKVLLIRFTPGFICISTWGVAISQDLLHTRGCTFRSRGNSRSSWKRHSLDTRLPKSLQRRITRCIYSYYGLFARTNCLHTLHCSGDPFPAAKAALFWIFKMFITVRGKFISMFCVWVLSLLFFCKINNIQITNYLYFEDISYDVRNILLL